MSKGERAGVVEGGKTPRADKYLRVDTQLGHKQCADDTLNLQAKSKEPQ